MRASTQIAVAAVLDGLLHDGDILRSGSQRMADALSTTMLDGLGLSTGRAGKAATEHDEPDAADDNAMLAMPITEVVAVEVPETAPALRRSARRQAARAPHTRCSARGCVLYELIPNIPEHRLLPLMQRFAEMLVSSGLFGGFLSGTK